MSIVKPSDNMVEKASEIIKTGGLVAFPTETVYGLGANGLDEIAVAKIFEAKERPFFDPLILHVSDIEMFDTLCKNISEKVHSLIEHFWPGPLTIVVEKSEIVPDLVSAGLPTVAVRMPSHPIALDLISRAGVPIAAPSANPFGYLSPTRASHVDALLGDRVDMVIDGGYSSVGVESTIIRVTEDKTYLLRPGGLSIDKLKPFVGEIIYNDSSQDIPDVPGQLPSHYSPTAKVIIIEEGDYPSTIEENSGLLSFRNEFQGDGFSHVEVLSTGGDLEEAAANLFSHLHKMDEKKVSVIYAEKVPENGLGLAIMNRLRKAAY